MPTSEYLLDSVTASLRDAIVDSGHVPASRVGEIQNKIDSLFKAKSYADLEKYLKEIEKEFSLDAKSAIRYVKMAATSSIADTGFRKILVDEGVYEGLKLKMEANPRQLIFEKDMKLTYGECKLLIRRLIDEHFRDSEEEEPQNRFVFPFIISENFEASGEMMLKNFEKAQSVALVSVDYYADNRGTPRLVIRMFGEKSVKRNTVDFSENFYIYNFIGDNKQHYLVFSKDELPEGHSSLKGMLVGVMDEIKIGNSAMALTNISVIFATEVKSDVHVLTEEEFKAVSVGWNSHDLLAEKVFGKLRHPPMFEKLILAWMFSGKFTGFPLHLGWIAQNGTGKSHMLEAITSHVFGEHHWDGTSSTGLTLIPSYGAAQIEPGYLIRQRRLGAIDEFFSGFYRSGRKENRLGQESAFMTSILEHRTVPLGSGKHSTVYAKAKAKFIFATNPVSKISTMTEAAAELPRQFLSRALWYVQTKSHVDFITERKPIIDRMPEEMKYPKRDDNFIMAYDYLTSFTVEIPLGPDREIFDKYKSLLPDELLQEVYVGRSYHHILCLIDGIAKYNSLIERRPKIICTPRDIADAETLFAWVVSTWNANADLTRMPLEIRYEYLPAVGQKVFDTIDKNRGLTAAQIEKKAGISSTDYWLIQLINIGLVNIIEETNGALVPTKRYYPYTCDLALESLVSSNAKHYENKVE